LNLDQYWRDLPGHYNPTGEFGKSDCWETWLDGLDWVIGGGESGREEDIRPCHLDWARSLRDQCVEAANPPAFFWKQWGEWLPFEAEAQAPFWRDQTGESHDSHGLNVLDPETGGMGEGWHEDSIHGEFAYKRVGKAAAGRLLDGREWNEIPEVNV
jgi:protein gp37